MGFSNDKVKRLDDIEKMLYLSKYHKWLKEQREKDKKKVPYKHVATGQAYLKKNQCPYCKNELDVKDEQGLKFKSCKKHGLVQIRK